MEVLNVQKDKLDAKVMALAQVRERPTQVWKEGDGGAERAEGQARRQCHGASSGEGVPHTSVKGGSGAAERAEGQAGASLGEGVPHTSVKGWIHHYIVH